MTTIDAARLEENVNQIMKDHMVSCRTGFLAENPLTEIPHEFANASARNSCLWRLDATTRNLPWFINEKLVEESTWNLALPDLDWTFDDLAEKASWPIVHLLMLDVAMLTHAYWREKLNYKNIGELMQDESIKHLPEVLALPLWKLSQITGIAPSLAYTLYSLWNHRKKDPEKPFDFDNIELIRSFTGSEDERWFVVNHHMQEIAFASAIPSLLKAYLLSLSLNPDTAMVFEMGNCLKQMLKPIHSTPQILKRMPERCDHRTYFDQIRLFYGFPRNVVFVGVKELKDEPQTIGGETGGHSPYKHLLWTTLGIDLDDILYIRELRSHMSRPHRKLIEEIKKTTRVRHVALKEKKKGNREPAEYYNQLIELELSWQDEHRKLVEVYIKDHGETHGSGSVPLELLQNIRDRIASYRIP